MIILGFNSMELLYVFQGYVAFFFIQAFSQSIHFLSFNKHTKEAMIVGIRQLCPF